MAASGNMYCTGDPDRAPIRSTEPTGYAHSGAGSRVRGDDRAGERAPPTRRPLDAGSRARRQHGGPRPVPRDRRARQPARRQHRPHARDLADGRRLRLVRPARRQGRRPESRDPHQARGRRRRARATRSRTATGTTSTRTPRPTKTSPRSRPRSRSTSPRHTMQELYDIAVETNLMLAPANSPREIYQSAQLAARDFFGPVGDVERFPQSFVITRSPGDEVAPVRPAGGARDASTAAAFSASGWRATGGTPGRRAWEGLKILEFGSGAAGPIATRYFVEHGATVLRVESKTRPDFLRAYSMAPDNPNGLEFSTMYDGLNVGKKNVALNLKKPEAVALVKRLVTEWGDAVAENYAPKAMKGFGLDYDTLAAIKPDLVMIERVPQRPDRPAQGLPGLRRAGRRARRLQRAHRLARPRAGRPVRHDHRLARAALRRGRARGRAAVPPPHRQGRVPRHLAGRVGELVAVAVAARLRDRRRASGSATATGTRTRARTARSRAPTRATSATVGSRSRAGPTTQWAALARRSSALDDDCVPRRSLASRKEHEDEIEALVSAWTATRTACRRRRAAAGDRHRGGTGRRLRRPPRRSATRAPRPLRAAHARVPRARASTSATASACRTRRAGTSRPGRRSGQDSDWVLRDLLGLHRRRDRRDEGFGRGRVEPA